MACKDIVWNNTSPHHANGFLVSGSFDKTLKIFDGNVNTPQLSINLSGKCYGVDSAWNDISIITSSKSLEIYDIRYTSIPKYNSEDRSGKMLTDDPDIQIKKQLTKVKCFP